MKLSKLLESIDVIEVFKDEDLNIEGIAYDSRKVKPGDLFVCIKGYKTDGHKYIPQAIKNGAIALIVEEFNRKWNIPQYKVGNSREALSALSSTFYNYPSKDIKIIGITGTNGKTSTSLMVDRILEEHNLNAGLIGTIVVKYGNYLKPSVLTTPDSLELQELFYNMKKYDLTHVTMEVSSSALELKRVADVDYDIVALNNISREHIDLHGSFEDYFSVKSNLIRNMKEDGWAVLNMDCPYSSSLVGETKANVLSYGIQSDSGDLIVMDLDLSTGRAKFTVELTKTFKVDDKVYEPQRFDIELAVPGYHSVYNSLLAIAVGLLCKVPVETIQRGLKSFKGAERRFQFIYDNDFKIIDDHFANTGNINVTMKTLSLMEYKNLHLVYAIRGSRGVTTNRENAETIAEWFKKLGKTEIIATKSISHVTDKDKVLDSELAAFMEIMERENIKVHLYDELPDAISHAQSVTSEGDVILLAGCQGMDYGAQIILENLYKQRPNLNKDELFEPLANRVAGIA